jgi:NAD(P)-dependent dehydrogenase (short-subunit alcohol dehydrogenase family)
MTGPLMSLDGKRVVVIGGGTGIGFAVASIAQELGAEVVIASSQASNVEAALARLPGATGEIVDVRDEASVARLFETVGPFDHLAFTAGDWGGRNFGATQDLDLVAARRGLDVRFWGAVCAVKYAVRTIAVPIR